MNSHEASLDLQRTGIAGLDARSVHRASVAKKNVDTVMQFMGMVRACFDAFTARDTPIGKITKLRLGMLPFGVVAPEALHRTSFEEHRCADARSIVQREALNVENNICSIHYTKVPKETKRKCPKLTAPARNIHQNWACGRLYLLCPSGS